MQVLVLEPYELFNLLRENGMASFIYPVLSDKARELADQYLATHTPVYNRNLNSDRTVSKAKTLAIFELILQGKNTVWEMKHCGVKRPLLRLNVKRGYLRHDNRRKADNKYYLTPEGLLEYQRLTKKDSENCITK